MFARVCVCCVRAASVAKKPERKAYVRATVFCDRAACTATSLADARPCCPNAAHLPHSTTVEKSGRLNVETAGVFLQRKLRFSSKLHTAQTEEAGVCACVHVCMRVFVERVAHILMLELCADLLDRAHTADRNSSGSYGSGVGNSKKREKVRAQCPYETAHRPTNRIESIANKVRQSWRARRAQHSISFEKW